jgi:hypothetical protein
MIRLLRRARSGALALMLLSPGLGGMAAQALHPCPANAPMQAAGMHHPASHSHDGPASADPVCHCISSCAATASPATPTDGRVLVVAIRHVVVNAPLGTILPARQLPLDLLPPSTAPPLTPQSLA